MKKNQKFLMIFGGGLFKDRNGRWHTDSFDEGGDFHGTTNGRFRVEAAKILFKKDSNQIIIASGGRGQFKNIEGAPTVASVIKKELIELGLPDKQIIEDKKSKNTLEQLNYLVKFIEKNQPKTIKIISSEWAFARIKAFIMANKKFKRFFGSFRSFFVSAEKILVSEEPKKWERIIKAARQSKQIKERIKLEKQGIQDIKNGVYGKIKHNKL